MPSCTRCSFRNVEGARFCGNCGAPVLVHQKVKRGAVGIALTITAFLIVWLLVRVFSRDYSSWSQGGASKFDWTEFEKNFGIQANSETTPNDGFNPDSNESFTPYLLSKNPYKWKGHSGILNTQYTTGIWPNGNISQVAGYGVRFARMLDEQTAVYDVMTVNFSYLSSPFPNGQIAVIVPNSTPPDPQKQWKVLVEGPVTGTNAFGATMNVTVVKFEGYYEPPVPTPTTAPTATTAEAGQSNTMQPFTSADGRFSVLFPGPPTQSSQPIRQTTGETTMVYKFSANGDNGNAKYTAEYADYAPDSVAVSPQAFLQVDENFVVTGKTLLTDAVIDLDGIPGRSYAIIDSKGYKYSIHEFMDGTRFYQLSVITPKGYTATQTDQFMNSFRIQ